LAHNACGTTRGADMAKKSKKDKKGKKSKKK